MRRPRLFLAAIAVGSIAFTGFWLMMSGQTSAADATPSEKTAATKEEQEPAATIDPTSPNAACYVCHVTFVHEEISKVHFLKKITCIKCHGLSANHANDEDIGATKPDKVYRRKEVDRMCIQCHETHNVPAKHVIRRFLERKITRRPVVCSDCHGRHRLEQPSEQAQ